MSESTKVPICRRKEYEAWLERFQNRLWFHITVRKWNRAVKAQMEKDWFNFTDMLNTSLFALYNPKTNTPKIKFMKHFGFGFMKDIVGKDGNTYQIWYRRK